MLRFLIALLTLTAIACGSSNTPTAQTAVECAKRPAQALLDKLLQEISTDGDPESFFASEGLVATAWQLAGVYGLGVVKCAVAEVEKALKESKGTRKVLGQDAAIGRAHNLLERLNE